MKTQNKNNKTKKQFRPAVFIVVYRLNNETNSIEYILLKRKLHWLGWEFPKGGIEAGEKLLSAVKRECKEETGLKPIKIKAYNLRGRYKYHKTLADRPGYIGQSYVLLSAEVKKAKIKLDKEEHSSYVWLSFPEAIKKLTWKNQKKCLKRVNKSLIKNN